jgi:carbonic anhydrase
MCENCAASPSRRRFLQGAVAVAGTLALPAVALGAEPGPAPNPVSPDDALKRLADGNARYAANTSSNRDYSAGRVARSLGQYPFATVISCADSRVAPEFIFDQGPGELFVIRVAGNFVNEDGLASVEYGTAVLGVKLIVVLGHSSCGAVDATIKAVKDGAVLPGHLPSLVAAIRPSVEEAIAEKPADLLAAATVNNVRHNVEYLQKADPILAGPVAAGQVKVVGGVYDIATGKVTMV